MRFGSAGTNVALLARHRVVEPDHSPLPRWSRGRRASTQSTIARPLALSSGIGARLGHPLRPVGLRRHRPCRSRGWRAGRTGSRRAGPSARRTRRRARGRPGRAPHAPRLAADRAGEQLHERGSSAGTGGRRRAPPRAGARCRRVLDQPRPTAGVWNSFSIAIRDDPGEQRHHLVDEAAHEADSAAPPISSRNTKMSSAVIPARLARASCREAAQVLEAKVSVP